MKPIPLTDLYATAKNRPAGYIDDVLSRASVVTETHYTLTDEAWLELAKKYRRARALPVQKIDGDFDVQAEIERMRAGGCCGGASK